MKISFETPKHEEMANDQVKLDRWCPKKAPCTGQEVRLTLDTLSAAETLFDVPKTSFHPHPLTGKYKGYFSVWINKKSRIVFRPDHAGDSEFSIDNYKTIKSIIIVELCIDYHGH
ncbi:MAG: hypothetical protein WBP12_02785 [Candidatus Saccharimonas sp.]